ncbi:hypothetical protein ACW185_08980 [Limosilactobacillus fermentum]
MTALVLSWMVGPRLQRHNDRPANLGLVSDRHFHPVARLVRL